jgi:hypothetical protein
MNISWPIYSMIYIYKLHPWERWKARKSPWRKQEDDIRSEFFTPVEYSFCDLCFITSCSLVGEYQRFEGTYCLHVQFCPPTRMNSGVSRETQYEKKLASPRRTSTRSTVLTNRISVIPKMEMGMFVEHFTTSPNPDSAEFGRMEYC